MKIYFDKSKNLHLKEYVLVKRIVLVKLHKLLKFYAKNTQALINKSLEPSTHKKSTFTRHVCLYEKLKG